MKKANKIISILLSLILIATIVTTGMVPSFALTNGDFDYTVANELTKTAYITAYNGTDETVVIPSEIDGYMIYCIYNNAFSKNSTMVNVVIPDSITTIGVWAFYRCTKLESVNLSKNITSIHPEAFTGCSSLTSINVSDENSNYCDIDGVLYNKAMTRLIKCPENKAGDFVMVDSVTTLSATAFSGCQKLTSITFGKDYIFDKATSYAFNLTTNIENYYVNENNNTLSSIDGVLYNKDGSSLIMCPRKRSGDFIVNEQTTEIYGHAFLDCSNLKSIQIPNTVTTIGYGAFKSCTGLTEIVLPENLNIVEDFLFSYCTSLLKVVIPKNVKEIKQYAFENCANIEEVWILSSDCIIRENAIPTTMFIVGFVDSTAEAYAHKYGNDFGYILILGDLDLNGDITITDARILLKSIVGTYELDDAQKIAGDVNLDDNISIVDARLILKSIVET